MQILTILAGAAFLFVAIGILFGSHYFIYYSVMNFFGITGTPGRVVLGIALFLLAISFILSSITAHWVNNIFSRSFYFLASLWLGIVVNLFLAFLVAWMVVWLARSSEGNIIMPLIGTLAILAALAYSAYGVWNAYYNVHVKDITVKIRNLPTAWQGRTAVQLSDIHIGHVFGRDYLSRLVAMTNELHPDVVFITGDLFDGMDGALDNEVEPLNDLVAPKGVYFITGNHETYFGVDKVYAILKKVNVRVLDNEMVDIDGVEVIGASYPERGAVKDIVATISGMVNFDKSKPNILLYHSPTHIDEVKKLGINLQLAGHTHKGQIFPFGLITKLVYKGYDYGLHEEGDYTEYTTNGAGAWGPTMRTANQPEIVAIKFEAK